MAIKVVSAGGASTKALAVGRELVKKMQVANKTGKKAITIDGTTIIAMRTESLEIVFPLLPQFKTFNHLEPWSHEQEFRDNNRDEILNNLSGVSPIQILTEEEVNDPDNEAGRKILAADFPDTFRVLGAKGDPFYQDTYNTYASATSNELLKTLVDTAFIDIVDDEILTNVEFLEVVEFYNNTPTMFEQLLSRIPDDVCVEDILWEETRGQFSSFPTYNGQQYFQGTQSPLHDNNFPILRPFITRKTPAGEYITICEVELVSNDENDFEQLNDFYTGLPLADSAVVNTNTSRNSFIVIPTKNLFDLKNSRFSTASTENDPDYFRPLEGLDPNDVFSVMTGRYFSIDFNVGPDDTNIYPEENVLDQIGANLNALFNAEEYHSRFGEGETNFDYFFDEPQTPDLAIDPAKVFAQGGVPWDQISQHNDWVQGAFWFIPLRLNITLNSGVFTGNLIYTVGVYQPVRNEFQSMDGFSRIEVLDELYLPDLLTAHPDIESAIATIRLLTGITDGTPTRGEQEETLFYSEGNFDDVREVIHNEVSFFSYSTWNQANRGTHFGWVYFEKRSNDKTRTGHLIDQGDDEDIDLDFADETIQVSQNVIDTQNYIFDHNGTNFTLDSNPPMLTLNINSGSSSLSAHKEGLFENITNYNPADFSVSIEGYSVFWEPTPGNPIGAYHVGPTSYNWDVNSQIDGDEINTTVSISTPDKFFVNDYILDAQNGSVGPNVRQAQRSEVLPVHVGLDTIRSSHYNRTLGNRFIHFDNETHQLMEGDTVLSTVLDDEQIQSDAIFGGVTSVLFLAAAYDFGTMFESNYDYIYSENQFVGVAKNYSAPGVSMSIQVPIIFMRHNGDNLPSILFSEIPVHPDLQAYDQSNPIQPPQSLSYDSTSTVIKLAALGTYRAVDTNYPTPLLPTSTRAEAEDAGFIFSALETKPIYYSRGVFPFAAEFNIRSNKTEYKTIVGGASPGDLIEQTTLSTISSSGFMNLDAILIAYINEPSFDQPGGDHLIYNEFLNAQFFIDPVTGFPVADRELSGSSSITNEVERRIYFNRVPESEQDFDE